MRIFVAGLLCIGMAGCQTTAQPTAEQSLSVPANYRHAVADAVRKTFKDPDSIKSGAEISAPLYENNLLYGPAARVCVKANAHNSFGGYTGNKPVQFLFAKGHIVLGGEEHADIACMSASYSPFPEIEPKR